MIWLGVGYVIVGGVVAWRETLRAARTNAWLDAQTNTAIRRGPLQHDEILLAGFFGMIWPATLLGNAGCALVEWVRGPLARVRSWLLTPIRAAYDAAYDRATRELEAEVARLELEAEHEVALIQIDEDLG